MTKTALREALTEEEIQELPVPDGYGPWSHEAMLIAQLIDRVDHLAWMQTTGETPHPTPYPRPGVTRVKIDPELEQRATRAKAYLDAMLANGGEHVDLLGDLVPVDLDPKTREAVDRVE